MKKIIAVSLIAVILILSGCVSANERSTVKDGFETYFAFLQHGDYASANAMTFDADENDGIEKDIKENSVNDFIFQKITYEIWGISCENDIYYADLIIKQLSLSSAYGATAEEFDAYLKEAEQTGKSFSQYAIDDVFDRFFYKNLQNEEKFITLKCTVPCRVTDGSISIGMTSDFRNCLFGGELDAIKTLNNLGG